jgi:hypothetical protein
MSVDGRCESARRILTALIDGTVRLSDYHASWLPGGEILMTTRAVGEYHNVRRVQHAGAGGLFP